VHSCCTRAGECVGTTQPDASKQRSGERLSACSLSPVPLTAGAAQEEVSGRREGDLDDVNMKAQQRARQVAAAWVGGGRVQGWEVACGLGEVRTLDMMIGL
jgi:hypothetical protein